MDRVEMIKLHKHRLIYSCSCPVSLMEKRKAAGNSCRGSAFPADLTVLKGVYFATESGAPHSAFHDFFKSRLGESEATAAQVPSNAPRFVPFSRKQSQNPGRT